MNAIDDRYKKALLEEHDAYVRAKRTKDAEQVAKVLKDQYGHDVDKKTAAEPKDSAPERADAEKPPEAAVEPKPRRGRPLKQSDDAQASSK